MRPVSYEFRDIYLVGCSRGPCHSRRQVTEIMETDLACVIRSPQDLTDDHVQFFIYQVLRGVKYMHSVHVVHRDLVHIGRCRVWTVHHPRGLAETPQFACELQL